MLTLFLWLAACSSPSPSPAPRPAGIPLRAEPPAPTGGLVDLDHPATCAPCHGQVVAEWQESMHARAHHDEDPIYGAMRELRRKKQGDEMAAKCQTCHNPRAPTAPDSPAGKAGVSCATCHHVAELHRDRGPGAKALVFADRPLLRSARDLPPDASPVHETGPAAPFLADGQSICLTCHDATQTPAGAAACTTGPEHRSQDGSATCTSCHMPRADGPSGAVSTRDHHASHIFAGPHRAWYQDDPTFLATAVDLALGLDGSTARLQITNATGHALPTGFPGRMMLVKVRGLDAQGAEVWTNLGDDPMKQDPDAVFNKVYVDADGNPTPAPFAVELRRDNRLKPAETRVLTWTVPSDVATVEAKLVMRLLPPPLAATLGVAEQVEGEPRTVATVTAP